MKHRIALVTARPGQRSLTAFVDVADFGELSSTLTRLGARSAVCYWRDRIGDGHTEGAPFPVAELTTRHFEWLLGEPKGNTRAIYYDLPA